MNKKKVFIIGLIFFVILLLYSSVCYAKEKNKQIIIMIDGVTIEEFSNFSCFEDYKISFGLMSPYTKGKYGRINQYFTLGLGTREELKNKNREAYLGIEDINDKQVIRVFKEQVGPIFKEDSLYLLDYIKKMNDNHFGYLGSILKENGIGRLIIGDADSIDKSDRYAPYIFCDEKGIVDKGVCGSKINVTNSLGVVFFPHDYEKITKSFIKNQESFNLIALELGDILKLEKNKSSLSEAKWIQYRKNFLFNIDQFLNDLFKKVDLETTRIIVIAPNLGQFNQNPRGMLPIAMLGRGINEGILTSKTTKRIGIVSNVDFAPTVLNYWKLKKPSWMSGEKIETKIYDNSLAYLKKINNRINFINSIRSMVLKSYIFIQIILISIFSLLLIKKIIFPSVILKLFLINISIPVALLWIGLFDNNNLGVFIAQTLGISIVIILIGIIFNKFLKCSLLTFICLFTALSLDLDVLLGSPLMKVSVLGYCPIRGARFYGIGNEYMGILIGSLIMGITLALEKRKTTKKILFLIGIIFAVTIIIIASPNLGTNVGGTIAAAFGFSFTMIKLLNYPFNRKVLLFLMLITTGTIFFLFLYDSFFNLGQESHIGRFAKLILNGEIIDVFNILMRKILINIKLVRYTNWSILFLVSFLSLIFVFFKPFGLVSKIYCAYPVLAKGFMGVLAGSLMALLFNDSGIVAAATMMLFPANILLFMGQKRI